MISLNEDITLKLNKYAISLKLHKYHALKLQKFAGFGRTTVLKRISIEPGC